MTEAGAGAAAAFDATAAIQEYGPSGARQRAENDVEAHLRWLHDGEQLVQDLARKVEKYQAFLDQARQALADAQAQIPALQAAVDRAQQQRDQVVAQLGEGG